MADNQQGRTSRGNRNRVQRLRAAGRALQFDAWDDPDDGELPERRTAHRVSRSRSHRRFR